MARSVSTNPPGCLIYRKRGLGTYAGQFVATVTAFGSGALLFGVEVAEFATGSADCADFVGFGVVPGEIDVVSGWFWEERVWGGCLRKDTEKEANCRMPGEIAEEVADNGHALSYGPA